MYINFQQYYVSDNIYHSLGEPQAERPSVIPLIRLFVSKEYVIAAKTTGINMCIDEGLL